MSKNSNSFVSKYEWVDLASTSEDEEDSCSESGISLNSSENSLDKDIPEEVIFIPVDSETFDLNTGIRTVIKYSSPDPKTEDGQAQISRGIAYIRKTFKYRVEKRRVPKVMARRKKLAKFGKAANDSEGLIEKTTSCGDEIFIQYTSSNVFSDDEDERKPSVLGSSQNHGIECSFCGEGHLSHMCKNKPIEEAPKATTDQQPNFILPLSRYVPPHLREFVGTPSNKYSPSAQSEDLSIRVTNLPPETTVDDIRELFRKFGKITRSALPRNRKTNEIRGFAFVTFESTVAARSAVQVMDNYQYGYFVLSVEIAKPRK